MCWNKRHWGLQPIRWALAAALYAAPFWLVTSATGDFNFKVEIEGVTAGWVDANGFEHAVLHPSTGTLAHADLRVTKPVDRSSPLLTSRICDGQIVPVVRLEAWETTPELVRYYSIRLHDVFVTSVAVDSTRATNALTEQVSFNYGQIEWTYIETAPDGRPGHATSTAWDVGAALGGPSDPDSDDDGVPDSYEIAQHLKPLIDDAAEDADLDGMANLQEYWAGTAAGDSNSLFRITGIATPGVGVLSVLVTFSSVPGRVYDLYSCATVDGTYTLTDTVTATGATTAVALSPPGLRAFVRAKVRGN